MRAHLSLLLCLAACGAGVDERNEPFNCDVFTTGVASVASQHPISCQSIETNVALAKSMLVDAGIVPEAKADELFASKRLHYHAAVCLEEGDGDGCRLGRSYIGSDDIELNVLGSALLHEMIHQWQLETSPVGSKASAVLGGHVGWPQSYWDISRAYWDGIIEPQWGTWRDYHQDGWIP